MATPMEQAVVELQILVRQLRQKLLGLERRLGVEEDPPLRPSQAVPTFTPLKSKEQQAGAVSHTAGGWVEPYDIAPPRKETTGPAGTAVAVEGGSAGGGGDQPGGGRGEEVPRAVSVPVGTPRPVSAGTPEAPKVVEVPNVVEVPKVVTEGAAGAGSTVDPAVPAPAAGAATGAASEPGAGPVAAGPAPYETVPPTEKDRSQPLYAWDTTYLYRPADEREVQQAEARAALEKNIGENVASWVGSLVLIAGMLFLIKYAWDVQWQTPMVRVFLTLVDGLAVVGVGAWLHYRKTRPLSAAIAAIGVAVMMGGIFAGNVEGVQPAIGFESAMIGTVAVGLFGVLVAWRMGVETMAVLAFLGMYLAPVILRSDGDGSSQLLSYLLHVTVCALALPALLRKWYAVRMAAFFCAWTWVLYWVLQNEALGHVTLGAGVIAGFFAIFLLELASDLPRFGRVSPGQRSVLDAIFEGQPHAVEIVIAVFSSLNTLAAMVAFWVIFSRAGQPGVALVALGMAGVLLAFAWAARSRIVATAAVVQAVGLMVVAVPLYFEGVAISAGWAVLALGLAVIDRVRNSTVARGWMVVVVGLLTGNILIADSMNPVLQRALITFDEVPAGAVQGTPALMTWQMLTGWMLIAWSAADLTLVLGWLTRERNIKAADGALTLRGAAWATVACLSAGTVLVAVSAVRGLEPHAPATLAVLAWVAAVIGFCRLRSFQETEETGANVENLAAVALMVITVKWAVYDGLGRATFGAGVTGSVPFLNLFFLTAILLAGAVLLSRGVRAAGAAFAGWWVTAVGFIALNVEALRAVDYFGAGAAAGSFDPWIVKCVALSILWGLVGFGLVLTGLLKNAAHIRWVGLVLLGVTVAKVLFVDTASANMILRVLSFMVVGVVLLMVSYAYHKVSFLPRGAGAVGAGGPGGRRVNPGPGPLAWGDESK